MKNQFVKLFEFKEHQVLLAKDYDTNDNNEDEFIMTMTTALDSVQPSMNAIYNSEEKRDEEFEKYNRDSAEKFLKQMRKALEN